MSCCFHYHRGEGLSIGHPKSNGAKVVRFCGGIGEGEHAGGGNAFSPRMTGDLFVEEKKFRNKQSCLLFLITQKDFNPRTNMKLSLVLALSPLSLANGNLTDSIRRRLSFQDVAGYAPATQVCSAMIAFSSRQKFVHHWKSSDLTL